MKNIIYTVSQRCIFLSNTAYNSYVKDCKEFKKFKRHSMTRPGLSLKAIKDNISGYKIKELSSYDIFEIIFKSKEASK